MKIHFTSLRICMTQALSENQKPMTKKRLVAACLCLLFLFTLGIPVSYAQADCNKQLLEASRLYKRGFFNRTVEILTPCKPSAFINRESTIEAYRLIALSKIALDQEEGAHTWIKNIVALDKKYSPNPSDLLRFRELVEEFRPPNRTLLVSGLGAAAAVTTVLLLTGGAETSSESPLPGPISLPQ